MKPIAEWLQDAIEERGLKSTLFVELHDEAILRVPESEIETVKSLMEEYMREIYNDFHVSAVKLEIK